MTRRGRTALAVGSLVLAAVLPAARATASPTAGRTTGTTTCHPEQSSLVALGPGGVQWHIDAPPAAPEDFHPLYGNGVAVVDGVAVAVLATEVVAANATTGAVLWTKPLSGPGFGFAFAGPHEVIVSADTLTAYNPGDGSVIWTGRSDYLLAGGSNLIAELDEGPSGRILAAVDPVTGATEWTLRTASDSLLRFTPDLILNPQSAGDVIAYDRRTGKQLWTHASGQDEPPQAWSAAGVVVIQSVGVHNGSHVTGVDARTGKTLWSLADKRVNLLGVDGVDSRGVTLTEGPTGALAYRDVHSGRLRWSEPRPEGFAGRDTLVLGSQPKYVVVTRYTEAGGRSHSTVVGLNRTNGRVGWQTALPPGVSFDNSQFTAAGEHAVLGAEGPFLQAITAAGEFDIVTHKLLWLATPPFDSIGPPTVYGGTALEVTYDDTAYCPTP